MRTDAVDERQDLVAARHGERAARQEVVLQVHDQERVARAPHVRG